MSSNTKKITFKVCTLLCMVFIMIMVGSLAAHAGTLDDMPDPGGEVDVPIDGGLSLLVAAGVGYSFRKLKKKRNNCY